MIKAQQLSRYLMLQRPEHSGTPIFPRGGWPGGARHLELAENSQQLLPPALPWPFPGLPHANHPGASFAYTPAYFHIPQLWVAGLPQGRLTAAPFVFTCHPGSCSFILRSGGKRKQEKRKGKGEKTLKTKRQAPSGQQEENATVWSLDPGGSKRCRDRPGGWLEEEILDLSELAPFPASSFTWLWHPGQVTVRLVPLFPHWGNGALTPVCGCYLECCRPPDSAPVFTPAAAEPGQGRDWAVCADSAAWQVLQSLL